MNLDLLTAAEAADYMRLSPQYLARLRCQGGGPGYLKPNRRKILYRREALDVWLLATERANTTHPAALN
ncbi:MAG: helix-turn-helix domain-containing protein [Hyphomonadaceae bacterium]